MRVFAEGVIVGGSVELQFHPLGFIPTEVAPESAANLALISDALGIWAEAKRQQVNVPVPVENIATSLNDKDGQVVGVPEATPLSDPNCLPLLLSFGDGKLVPVCNEADIATARQLGIAVVQADIVFYRDALEFAGTREEYIQGAAKLSLMEAFGAIEGQARETIARGRRALFSVSAEDRAARLAFAKRAKAIVVGFGRKAAAK